jgi:hypothetical protein
MLGPLTFRGRLSKSGQVVLVQCPGCGEEHQHQATDGIRAGERVLLYAKCEDTIATESGRVEPNRSAFKGGSYYIRVY